MPASEEYSVESKMPFPYPLEFEVLYEYCLLTAFSDNALFCTQVWVFKTKDLTPEVPLAVEVFPE